MSRRITPSKETYLETIKHIAEQGCPVRVKDIAGRLQVSLPSVTGALKALVSDGLVRHERYGGIELTDEGHALAAEIDSRHGILYAFLTEILGIEPALADRDSCIIEHVISSRVLMHIKRYLEFIRQSTAGEQLVAQFHERAPAKEQKKNHHR